MSLTFQFKG